jgi:hypothetical protein
MSGAQVRQTALGSSLGLATTTINITGLSTLSDSLFIATCVPIGTNTVTSVTDSAGNSWSAVTSNTTTQSCYIFKTTNASPAAITSLAVNLGASTNCAVVFLEVRGAINDASAEATSTATGTSTSPNSGTSARQTRVGALAVGVTGHPAAFGAPSSSAFAFTAGTPAGTVQNIDWTDVSVETWNDTSHKLLNVNAPGQAYSLTLASSVAWAAQVALIPSRSGSYSGVNKRPHVFSPGNNR